MTSAQGTKIDQAFMQDPHAFFDRLREEGPVHRVTMPQGMPAWIVTGYADARAALADPRLRKNNEGLRELFARHGNDTALSSTTITAHMLNSDPPDHTRLRKLVNKAFTMRGIEHLRPRIERITDELLDAAAQQDTVDLLEALAFPLPITVISELLGVPETDSESFRAWSNTLVSAGKPEEIHAASQAMSQYLINLVATKREQLGSDMLSALVAARDSGDKLSESELVSMAFLLLIAGHETTVNLIGNGMLALLRNENQLAALRADRALLPNAIEEFLRFDGPVNLATLRFTSEPVTIGETTIPADEFVLVSLIAANRDATRFTEPHRLDVTRQAGGHLGFGHGIHYCVGAPLARLEAEVAFGKLLDRFQGLSLAAEPETLRWRESTLMHGLHTLPVRLR